MKINVLLFGRLRDLATNDELVVEGVSDTAQLLHAINKLYPGIYYATFTMAVDEVVVTKNTMLNENSIVALMPPFSGG